MSRDAKIQNAIKVGFKCRSSLECVWGLIKLEGSVVRELTKPTAVCIDPERGSGDRPVAGPVLLPTKKVAGDLEVGKGCGIYQWGRSRFNGRPSVAANPGKSHSLG